MQKRDFLKQLGIAVIVLIGLSVVVLWWLKISTNHGQQIEVPDRRGKKGLSERIQKSIRRQVAGSIESLVDDMLAMRSEHSGEDGALRRLLTR